MAPAMAVPVREEDKFEFSMGLEVMRPLGRFWRERREIGLKVGLVELNLLVELILKHLELSMAIVDMVAAIDDFVGGVCYFP